MSNNHCRGSVGVSLNSQGITGFANAGCTKGKQEASAEARYNFTQNKCSVALTQARDNTSLGVGFTVGSKGAEANITVKRTVDRFEANVKGIFDFNGAQLNVGGTVKADQGKINVSTQLKLPHGGWGVEIGAGYRLPGGEVKGVFSLTEKGVSNVGVSANALLGKGNISVSGGLAVNGEGSTSFQGSYGQANNSFTINVGPNVGQSVVKATNKDMEVETLNKNGNSESTIKPNFKAQRQAETEVQNKQKEAALNAQNK